MERVGYIKLGEGLGPVSDDPPDEAFGGLYGDYRRPLEETLLELKKEDGKLGGYTLRAGALPPVRAAIGEEVRRFCSIPYRHSDGKTAPCGGVVDGWRGCPPHSPAVRETIGLLEKARLFLILQFDGIGDHRRQVYVNRFSEKAAGVLEKRGFAVIENYGCGPCRVCSRGCGEGDCRLPDRRDFALESCGFWVNRLCREAASFPILGEGPVEIEWVIDWGLPTQEPEFFKSVTGLLLG